MAFDLRVLTALLAGSVLISPQHPVTHDRPPQDDGVIRTLRQEIQNLRGLGVEVDVMRRELQRLRGLMAAKRDEVSPPIEVEEPWRLFSSTPKTPGFRIRGWVEQSFTFNPDRPTDHYNGPVTPLDRANKYQLDEIYATIENPSILSGDDWRVGARVDFVYGTTYRFLTSAGLESSWNTGRSYGLAMPNAYAEVQLGAVDTKLGHFTSPVGYCAIGAANNFFAVLPYTFQYGEPFTHTGFLSSTKLGGGWSAGAGLTDGWDSTANWSSESRGFGSDAWNRHVGGLGTLSKSEVFDAHDSLDCVFVSSEEPDSTGIGRTPRYLQTVVYSREVASDWTWIVQSDFGTQRAAIVSPTGSSSAQWYGLNQFLFWQVAPQWRLGANVEWFRDEDGFRVGGAVPSYGSPSGGSFRRGLFQGNFFRLMVGPKWTPSANVIVRPAIAFDRYEGPGVAGLRPFDDGTSDHQWLAVLDVILRF